MLLFPSSSWAATATATGGCSDKLGRHLQIFCRILLHLPPAQVKYYISFPRLIMALFKKMTTFSNGEFPKK